MAKNIKKSIFSALWVDRDQGFSQGPLTPLFPVFWIIPTPLIPQKFPPKPPKSPRNFQNLKKSNFSALGLGRDLRFSRVLQSHSSPHSEYYPHLCPPKKSPSHHICWFCINFTWNDNLTLIVLLVICKLKTLKNNKSCFLFLKSIISCHKIYNLMP